jgi:glycosyltransferase involved in cell wall biosynthesis
VTHLSSIDVIIAVRNEERRIGACIESLLSQDYPAELVNIFVVDNDSDDSTAEIVKRYPVTLLSETTPGSAAARNRAFSNSNGDLVAFFDGHCIANTRWISAMSEQFRDARVGGAQARIDNAATDSRVIAYLENSGMDNHDHVLEDTIYGTHNVYPWVLSGNCMYRRNAVEIAGRFDEQLPACEDVDLAWKVVLAGFLLVDCPGASVVHWNDDDWKKFARKSWRQGRGSAVLAKRYLPHGAKNAFQPSMIWHRGRDRSLVALKYWGGYRYEAARIAAGQSAAARDPRLPNVDPSLRPAFGWTDEMWFHISTGVIYWFRGEAVSILVQKSTRTRMVLDESADLIWRKLAVGASRAEVSRELMGRYGIDSNTAEADLDEFVSDLEKTGMLMRVSRLSARLGRKA